ncbi:S8 family peptidase [Actinokineospora sp. 24-640]
MGAVLALAALASISGVPPVAGAAEGTILGAGAPNAVPGSYIVVLKGSPSTAAVDSTAQSLAGRHRGAVTHTYRSALRGFAIEMTEEQARLLAADPQVSHVEQDSVVELADQVYPPSWGLDRVDQVDQRLNGRYGYDATASNVTAYILDTGIRITHADFGGRARYGRDTVNDDNVADDCNGHGTNVAGTVGGSQYGVAKGVRLVAVKVLPCTGTGKNSDVIQGVDWVTANHVKPAVANMSLSSPDSEAMDAAVRGSINAGVTYVVAAGNYGGTSCNRSPARVEQALTVGASTITDHRADFSNHGRCMDLFAPGLDIVTAGHQSDVAEKTTSGTSLAAPHVAGAAALLLSKHPNGIPAWVAANIIEDAARDRIVNPGTNSPNLLLNTVMGPVISNIVCAKSTAQVTCSGVAASGVAPLRFRWYRNGVHVPEWDDRTSVTDSCAPGFTTSKSFQIRVTDANGKQDFDKRSVLCG